MTIDTRKETDRRQSTQEWLGEIDRRQNARRFEDKSLEQVRAEELAERELPAHSWPDAPTTGRI